MLWGPLRENQSCATARKIQAGRIDGTKKAGLRSGCQSVSVAGIFCPMKTSRSVLQLSHFSFLVAVLSAFWLPVTAQQPAAASRLPLWKVEGKRCTVYLLGSVHFLKAEHYPLPAPIEAAFERSKVAVFETDLVWANDPKMQAKLMEKAVLPSEQNLKDQLSPKLYGRLTKQLEASGLPLETVEKLRPGMVAVTLALVEMQKLGFNADLGVDRHFDQRARKAGKEIVGLEEAEFQIDLLTGFSKEEGEAMLASTLDDLHMLKTELGELLKAWRTGDMKTVADMLNKSMEAHPVMFQRLLVERNKSWVPRIEQLARGDKDAIVIVGAGHLAGKQNVIEMLEKNGWKVTQQ